MLSIVIPTLNEAAQVVETLTHLRSLAPNAELIVVDGGSADQTPERARPFARVIASRKGRARQMNTGAAAAHGDVLLFLHVDTRLPTGALSIIDCTLRDPHVVGGAFALCFDEPGRLYRVIAWSTNVRSHIRRVATGDQAIFVRTTVFRAIGGYADIPLMEDLELWKRLPKAGAVRFIAPPVLVSARRHRKYGPLRVVVTGWIFQILYAFGMPEFALHRLYYGRLPDP